MVDLVGTRTELRRVGQRWTGPVPVPRRAHAVVRRSTRAQALPLLRLRRGRRRDPLRAGDGGPRLRGRVESLADRYGVELEREEEDREAEQRRRRERLLELLDRTAAYYARYLWESPEAAPRARLPGGRGAGEEVLREFRVGYAPSAWDRCCWRRSRDGFSETS